jgi:hypothetical protein
MTVALEMNESPGLIIHQKAFIFFDFRLADPKKKKGEKFWGIN